MSVTCEIHRVSRWDICIIATVYCKGLGRMEARSLLLLLCAAACLSTLQGETDSDALTSSVLMTIMNVQHYSSYFEHHNAIGIM